MHVILPLNCIGSHFDSVIIFCIASRIHNVVNSGKFFHSSIIGSLYLRPEMHLFVVLENSTLRRRDYDLLRQVYPYFTNMFDSALWVSPDFSTQSDCSQSKNLSTQTRPSSLSTLTLSRSCSLPVLASLAQQRKLKWPMLTRLGHNSFVFFFWFFPLRHCGAACQAGILSAASGAEMTDIEQMKKMFPFITYKNSLLSTCLQVDIRCRRI